MNKQYIKIISVIALFAGGGGGITSQALAQDDRNRLYGSISYFVSEAKSDVKGSYNRTYDNNVFHQGSTNVPDVTINNVGKFDSDIKAGILRFGDQFHPNFSVEARYGFSGGDDKGSASVSASVPDSAPQNYRGDYSGEFVGDTVLDSLYGIYWRAGIPSGQFYPYGIVGYTQAQIETTKGQVTTTNIENETEIRANLAKHEETQSGISYGVGADFHVNDNLAINAEWMSYLDKDELDISGASLSLVYKFKIPR